MMIVIDESLARLLAQCAQECGEVNAARVIEEKLVATQEIACTHDWKMDGVANGIAYLRCEKCNNQQISY